MVCEADIVFPHESVAVHVRTITNLFTQVLSCFTWLKFNLTSPQLSDAVTLAGAGTFEAHATVVLAGTPESEGAVLSSIVMILVQLSCNKPLVEVSKRINVSVPHLVPAFTETFG
jgi:hypothetical protein